MAGFFAARSEGEWLPGGGEMGERIRSNDWSTTALGPRERWPVSMRAVVNLVVESSFPMALLWGRDLLLLYNDAYSEVAAEQHPHALGRPIREVWSELWNANEPIFTAVTNRGETVHLQDQVFANCRRGTLEDAYFTVSYSPVRLESGAIAGSLVTLFETTARVRQQHALETERDIALAEAIQEREALRASQERLQKAMSAPTVGVLFFRLDGVIHDANATFERMCGYTRDELRKAHWRTLTSPESWDITAKTAQDLATRGEVAPYEKQMVRKDGSRWWGLFAPSRLSGAGSDMECVEFIVDITVQKRTEAALCTSEEKFRSVFEHAAVGMARVSFSDARWIDVNDAFCKMLGRSREEMLRTPWPDMTHPEDLELDLNPFRRMAKGQLNTYAVEKRLIHKQGHHVWARLTLSLVRDGNGRPDYEIAVIEDVTERKNAVDALRDAKAQLERADRSKDEFFGMLSHELRNPLAPITNSVYMLRRAPNVDERSRKAIEVIDRQVKLLSHLIDDLLDVTRIARGKIRLERTRLDLVPLVRQLVDDQRGSMEANELALELRMPQSPVWVEGDHARITQALGNLLQNAAKFTQRGGRVTVVLATDHRGTAIIDVEDTGIGIDPETIEGLFRPFAQAERSLDRSRAGLGLGLALTKGLIELHHGSISAYSEGPGRGSRFTIKLPLGCEQGAGEEKPSQASTIEGAPARVLVIEDDPDSADSLKDVLESAGHVVEVSYDGEEGLQKARQYGPDVILCDIGLPGLDGYGVAHAVRADSELKRVHLVALTGFAQPDDVRRAYEAGFERHLAKPPEATKLDRLLRELDGGATTEGHAGTVGTTDHAPDAPTHEEAGQRCCVLLVDDDPVLRDSLASILRMEGFYVVEARDGPDCLRVIQRGLKPHATLLDYRMPGLNGAQVYEHLKSGGLGEAVVLMTAASAAPELAKQHGFRHFVSKPFGMEDLLELVTRVARSNGCNADGREAS